MLIQLPEPDPDQGPVPLSYSASPKITPLASPVTSFSDEEEATSSPGSVVDLEVQVQYLFKDVFPTTGYMSEKGLYFAGRRPSCTVIGLGRSDHNRSDEVHITTAEHLLQLGKLIREGKQQPYALFVIDALSHDALSSVEAIVRETAGNKLYFNHRPLVSVVEKGGQGLLSRLQERYSGTPLRFIEAQKHGDIIDAQLFGQLRY